MNDSIFRRVEIKYLISKDKKDELLELISDNLVKDDYYESHISNIYFDNVNNDLLISSLEKPLYKAKIRLRCYEDDVRDDTNMYLEIKEKYDSVVFKRRVSLTYNEYKSYMNDGIIKNNQIFKEIDYYFKKYNLQPYVYVNYDRFSYKTVDNSVRITIDSNLRSSVDNRDFIEYFDGDEYIVEIKLLDAMPLWLTSVLSKLKIYPTTFSKVGSVYTKIRKESEIKC